MIAMAREVGEDAPDLDPEGFGSPETELTTRVDVTPWLDAKRAAMRAHRSQIADDSFFLTLDDARFALAFGTEWFIRVGGDPAQREDTLFPV
jgi:LmbE family N-acetylglucosaminyl deacetylase